MSSIKVAQVYQVVRNTIVGSAIFLFIFWLSVFISSIHHTDTHIRADLNVRKEISFVTEEPFKFASIPFKFIEIRRFSKMEMNPNELRFNGKQQTITSPLVIAPKPEGSLSTSTVQIQTQGENTEKQSATFAAFEVAPGTKITLKTDENNPSKLEIAIKGKKFRDAPFSIHFRDSLQLTTDGCQFEGVDSPPQDNMNFTTIFPDTAPSITLTPLKITPDNVALELSLELNVNASHTISYQDNSFKINRLDQHPIFANQESVKVKNLELLWWDEEGQQKEKRTSLIGGQIYYVGYPRKDIVTLYDTDRIEFDKTEQLSLEKIAFNPLDSIGLSGSSIDLRVQAILTHEVEVATLSSKNTEFPRRNLRLTYYDAWSKWEFVEVISSSISLIIAVFAALIGLFAAWIEKDS
jgi:hypothetical protein